MNYIKKIKELYKDKKYTSTIDVALFIVLIFSFHFLYLGWQALNYFPISGVIDKLFDSASTLLFNQSCWVLEHIFNVDIVTHEHIIGVINCNNKYSLINVAPDCTSLKQWLHWIFLMLIFPGPLKHKLL